MSMPVSNPLGQLMARQQGATQAQYDRWRIQRARTLWSLATMLVGTASLVTGAALAWGWAGGLIAGGAALVTFGTVLGMTSAVPET